VKLWIGVPWGTLVSACVADYDSWAILQGLSGSNRLLAVATALVQKKLDKAHLKVKCAILIGQSRDCSHAFSSSFTSKPNTTASNKLDGLAFHNLSEWSSNISEPFFGGHTVVMGYVRSKGQGKTSFLVKCH